MKPFSVGDTPEKVVGGAHGEAGRSGNRHGPAEHVDAGRWTWRRRWRPPRSRRAHAAGGRRAGRLTAQPLPLSCRTRTSTISREVSADRMPDIQFDSKGVEFGPWLRRFVARSSATGSFRRRCSSRAGSSFSSTSFAMAPSPTSKIVSPSPFPAYNNVGVQRAQEFESRLPLPPEYPDDRAFFTVTFYYDVRAPLELRPPASVSRNKLTRCVRLRSWDPRPPARARSRSRLPSVLAASSSRAIPPRSTAASTSARTRCRSPSSAAFHTIWSTWPIPLETYSAARYARDAAGRHARVRRRGPAAGAGWRHRVLLPRARARPLPGSGARRRTASEAGAGREQVEASSSFTAGSSASTLIRALRIQPRDLKRLVRALEVYLLTGRPLTAHFDDTTSPIAGFELLTIGAPHAARGASPRVARRVDQQFAAASSTR